MSRYLGHEHRDLSTDVSPWVVKRSPSPTAGFKATPETPTERAERWDKAEDDLRVQLLALVPERDRTDAAILLTRIMRARTEWREAMDEVIHG